MDTNKEQFKIGFLSFIKPGILPFITTFFFVIVFIPLMFYTYGTEKQLGAWLVSIVWIAFTGIPPIVLHINYFLNDKNKCLEINKIKRTINLFEGNKTQSMKFDEIERIEKYQSKNAKNRFAPKLHWHPYYYYKIIIKNKEPIYISRMMIEKLEKKIEGINFKFVRVPYPYITKYKGSSYITL